MRRLKFVALALAAWCGVDAATIAAQTSAPKPEIIRTGYGVPHIYADNLWAAGYGLGWVQAEDYGARVIHGLVSGRAQMGRVFGRDSMEGDFSRRPVYAEAQRRWASLEVDTRDVYDGFAAAINDFIRANQGRFHPDIAPNFVGWDVLAREMSPVNLAPARRLAQRALGRPAVSAAPDAPPGDWEGPTDGSNAWAVAPSRTASGRAILMRNPHLAWTAGYYEAHVVVPGRFDFYGDFRIGSPFGVVGGFNRNLGWSTTNNNVDTDEVYAVPLAPDLVDHILIDGRPMPLEPVAVTVEYRNGPSYSSETRQTWLSPFGPVVERADGQAFILKSSGAGEHRGGEQFLRMMHARTVAEWEAALAMRARASSNFTYADRAGNILYVWNGSLPALPHPSGGDSTVVRVQSTKEIWSRIVPYDSLPRVKNPPGGYVHQENSSPHFTNLLAPLDPAHYPPNIEAPSLSLRSQLGADLIGKPGRKLTLEGVLDLKNSYRMLLAERIKPDLLRAAASASNGKVREATTLLEQWDNTTGPETRGGVLFEMWWRLYSRANRQPFATPWAITEPTTTPRGLANPTGAVEALVLAIDSVTARWGRIDVPWGEVHRVRIAGHDVPVGGCLGAMGCFRTLAFQDDPDGKRRVSGGDGWIIAVEFGNTPRAYSVLAYGQSNDPSSPYYGDQAPMFARGEFKPIAYTRADVEKQAVRRYRPGQ